MKLTMKEWAELDAMAETFKVTKRPSVFMARYRTEGELGALTKKGLVRWPSGCRAVVTRKGLALVASKSRRFLDCALRIYERAWEREHGHGLGECP